MGRFEIFARVAQARRFAGLVILASAAFVLACGGPMGPMSGGRLSGQEAPFPDDWKMLEERDTIELETRPDAPYSVTVWVVGLEGDAYISTSLLSGVDDPNERRWVKYVNEDPRVRVRIDEDVFPARLEKVNPEEVDPSRIYRAFVAKYPQIDTAERPSAVFFRIARR